MTYLGKGGRGGDKGRGIGQGREAITVEGIAMTVVEVQLRMA